MNQLILFILLSAHRFAGTTSQYVYNRFDSLDFEKIKIALFADEKLRNFSIYNFKSANKTLTYDDAQCEKEMIAIGNCLQNSDVWAIKRKFNYEF